MERGEPPPAEKVRYLRSEGKSYRWIADRYGISVELAYQLGHLGEGSEEILESVIDVRDRETQDA